MRVRILLSTTLEWLEPPVRSLIQLWSDRRQVRSCSDLVDVRGSYWCVYSKEVALAAEMV